MNLAGKSETDELKDIFVKSLHEEYGREVARFRVYGIKVDTIQAIIEKLKVLEIDLSRVNLSLRKEDVSFYGSSKRPQRQEGNLLDNDRKRNGETQQEVKRHSDLEKTCHFCHKPGHLKYDCLAYRDQRTKQSREKPNGRTVNQICCSELNKKKSFYYYDNDMDRNRRKDVSPSLVDNPIITEECLNYYDEMLNPNRDKYPESTEEEDYWDNLHPIEEYKKVFSISKGKKVNEINEPYRIPVVINGIILSAVLDTGADVSLLSKKVVEAMRINMKPSTQTFLLAKDGVASKGIGVVKNAEFKCGRYEMIIDIEVFDLEVGLDFLIGRDLDKKLGFTYSNIPTMLPDKCMNKNEYYSYYDVCKPFFEIKNETSESFSKKNMYELKETLDDNLRTNGKFCTAEESVVSLETGINKPLFIDQYSVKRADIQTVTDQVDTWFKNGVTVLSEVGSKWNSSLLVVPKKDLKGTLTGKRVCLDARPLNGILADDRHPLPKIKDIFERVSGHSVFTKLDLAESYHQFLLKSCDRVKTSFYWNSIHYMFRGTPFGIKTVTSIFQRVMSRILMNLHFAVAYVDDILIFSQSEEEHITHVKMVIEALTLANLTLRETKCQFGYGSLEMLGHLISAEGIQPTEEKQKSVAGFIRPKTSRDVQSFLGLVNYMRDYIPLYSSITYPLERIRYTQVIDDKVWSKECEQSFVALKNLLQVAPVIKFPDFDKKFYLATDASDFGIGAVLYQLDDKEENKRNYVGFVSRSLTSGEKNYTVTQRELIAIVYSVQKFNNYLDGRKFTIITDHRALIYLQTQKELSKVVARWYDVLVDYNFDVEFCPGVLNKLPDMLSRLYPDYLMSNKNYQGKILLSIQLENKVDDKDKTNLYKVNSDIFEICLKEFGVCSIDLFADGNNHKIETYKNIADSLSYCWTKEKLAWINSPWDLLQEVVEKIEFDRARAIVVTPYMKSAPWYKKLLTLCYAQPVCVEIQSNLDIPKSLANSKYERVTPWNVMIMWPVSARLGVQTVVIDPKLTKWKWFVTSGNGIELSTLNRLHCTSATPASEVSMVEQCVHDTLSQKRNNHESFCEKHYSFGQGYTSLFEEEGERLDDRLIVRVIKTNPDRVCKRYALSGDRKVNKSKAEKASSVKSDVVNDRQMIVPTKFSKEELNAIIKNKIVPEIKDRRDIIQKTHCFGHFGVESMIKSILNEGYFWMGMGKDCSDLVAECSSCQKYSIVRHGYNPLTTITARMPMDHLQIDLVSGFRISNDGNKYLCTVIDICTRFAFLRALKDKSARSVADVLIEIIRDFGIPKIIQSDNGTEFANEVMTEMCSLLKIDKRFSAPYHPACNGAVERLNQTVVSILRKMMFGETRRWALFLPIVQLAHNNKVSARNGCTPFSLMFTRKMNMFMDHSNVELTDVESSELVKRYNQAVDVIYPAVEERTKSYNSNMKMLFDKKHNVSVQFPSGSYVMVLNPTRSNKMEPFWDGPFVVLRRTTAGTYLLQNNATGDSCGAAVSPERMKTIKLSERIQGSLEIDYIVEHMVNDDKENLYRVRWKGQKSDEDTWEKADAFDDPETVTKYWESILIAGKKSVKSKPKKIRRERVDHR